MSSIVVVCYGVVFFYLLVCFVEFGCFLKVVVVVW